MSFVSFGPFVLAGGVVPNFPVTRGVSRPSGGFDIERTRLSTDAIGSSTLTLSGLPVGTDIVVLLAGTNTVLLQVDAHPATSYVYAYSLYTANTVVDIGLIKEGYEIQYIRGLTLPRAAALLPVALRIDRNFS